MRRTSKFDEFFLVYRYISGKNFREDSINRYLVKLLTNRQTDRQTSGGDVQHVNYFLYVAAWLSGNAVVRISEVTQADALLPRWVTGRRYRPYLVFKLATQLRLFNVCNSCMWWRKKGDPSSMYQTVQFLSKLEMAFSVSSRLNIPWTLLVAQY